MLLPYKLSYKYIQCKNQSQGPPSVSITYFINISFANEFFPFSFIGMRDDGEMVTIEKASQLDACRLEERH